MHLKFPGTALLLSLLLSVTLILSACGGNAAETPPPEQSSDTTPAAEVAASPETEATVEEPEPATATPAATEANLVDDDVASDEDEASVTESLAPVECEPIEIPSDDRIPAVSKDDWVKGSESATLTLIEYGDFQ